MKNLLLTLALLATLPVSAHATGLDCGSDNADAVNLTMAEGVRLDSSGSIFSITVTNMMPHSFRAQTNLVENRDNLLVLNFSTVTNENKLDDRSIIGRLELPVATNDKGVREASGPGRIVITRFPNLPIRFMRGSYALLNCQGAI